MAKKRTEKKVLFRKTMQKLQLPLYFLIVIFLIISFINPSIGKTTLRTDCQLTDFKFKDLEDKFCVEFTKTSKFFGNDTIVKIYKNEDKEDNKFENGYFFRNDNIDAAVGNTKIDWEETGIKFSFEDQEITIRTEQFK